MEISKWASRPQRAGTILELAGRLAENPELLNDDDQLRQVAGLTEAVADLAVLVVPTHGDEDSEEPVLVTKGVLRVAARFSGDPVDRRNRLTDGRLEIARMIGADSDARRAHLGLVELANTLCRQVEPECNACPLQKLCAESRADPLRLF